MSSKKLSILEEFQKLKLNSTSSKVDSKAFQPNDKDQKRLIVRNISSRMVSMAIKRESTKYIFSEKIKVEEEIKRREQEQLESKDGNSTTESSPSKPDLKRGRNEKKEKKQTSSSNEESMMNRIVRSHSTLSILRPSTGGFVSPNEEYANILKEGKNPQEIVGELHIQAQHQAKDSKRIFEILCSNYPSGKVVQFSPKKLTEDLDLSYLSNDNNLLANVTKLEDLAQLKAKKDGLMIIFDPSTHSHSFKATIKITYMKSIDIATEEQVSKEYIFWSDGNYFGLQFIRENYKNAITEGSSASRFNSTASIASLTSSISMPVDEQDPEIIKISLPGWQNRPPIFIPASKCQIQIIKLDEFAKVASVANNITRLKLYVLTSSGMRNGLKKVHDFLRPSILQDIANLKVPGGLSALNFASLQGNLMAVEHLVAHGANINYRCKSDHHCTPLHEAVIGGHVEIVQYLLSQGANQLIKDDYGMTPLHYACKNSNVSIARILMESPSGKRALLQMNNNELQPIQCCTNNFLKARVESIMKKFRIFVKPRVSILDRNN